MRGQDSDLDAGWTQVVSSDELTPGKNKAIIHNNAGYASFYLCKFCMHNYNMADLNIYSACQ
jgi:hypothetical protein